ncbi:MAG: hypothetical protein AAGH41_00230 [Pseudomonadota bacterium]
MDSTFIAILVAAVAVVAGTFVLKAIMGSLLKIVGLIAVAFFGRREQVGADGFTWVVLYDGAIILGAALAGWLVSIALNLVVFRKDGFGRHFFSPLIAVAFTFVAAYLTQI